MLARGEQLRIIDTEGGQTGDLMAFSRNGQERLSNGRTFDYGGKIYLSTGDVLWSDRSNPMLTIIEDQVGRHDFLYSSCSLEMYRIQYGVTGYHPNCHDNLVSELRELGITPDYLPTAFNFFMNVDSSPRRAPRVRTTQVPRRRLDRPSRRNGSRNRIVGMPRIDLQRRRAAAATRVRSPIEDRLLMERLIFRLVVFFGGHSISLLALGWILSRSD